MSEQAQHNDFLPPASAEQDVVALIEKIQQRLVFLEKKMDILISQSQARPFSEKHFSKPFRSFGYPDRRSDREPDNASGEKNFDRGRHFEKSHGEKTEDLATRRRLTIILEKMILAKSIILRNDTAAKREGLIKKRKEETIWLFKVDMTNGHGRCIKRSVLIARKSAKFPSGPAEIVQFTARIAFQSARKKVVRGGFRSTVSDYSAGQ